MKKTSGIWYLESGGLQLGGLQLEGYNVHATDFGTGDPLTRLKGSGGLQSGGLQSGGLQFSGPPILELEIHSLALRNIR